MVEVEDREQRDGLIRRRSMKSSNLFVTTTDEGVRREERLRMRRGTGPFPFHDDGDDDAANGGANHHSLVLGELHFC